MKFKFSCKKGSKWLIKMVLDDGREVWAETEQKVATYAKNQFTEDEECDFEYNVKNNQYFVSKILKKGSSGSGTKKTEEGAKYTCEDCGAELKDGKYRKCYNCNKKKGSTSGSGTSGGYSGDYMRPKTPEESERILRLSLLDSVCEAVKVMTGSVDNINVLGENIEALYDRLYKKIKE